MEKYNIEKYQIKYPNGDGTSDIWTFDKSITKNGPISTEMNVKDDSYKKVIVEDEPEKEQPSNESLPKTKRMYLNPANNKMVGYARAKFLKLID